MFLENITNQQRTLTKHQQRGFRLEQPSWSYTSIVVVGIGLYQKYNPSDFLANTMPFRLMLVGLCFFATNKNIYKMLPEAFDLMVSKYRTTSSVCIVRVSLQSVHENVLPGSFPCPLAVSGYTPR